MPSTSEASTVRERSPAPPPASELAEAAPRPASGSAGSTWDRLDVKLRTARAVLASLSATDDRARLLHIAILRRDESLLEGVLAALKVGESKPPAR
jgi:hypothetical protein